MDQTESLSDMDWSSPMISGMMCTYEEADDEADFMMAQLLSNFPISSNHETTTTTNYHHHLDSDFFSTPSFWPSSSAAAGNTSSQHLSTSYTGSYSATISSSQQQHHHHHPRNTSMDLHDQLLDSSSLPPLMSIEDGPVSMRLCVGGVGEEEAMNTSSCLAQSDETLIPKMVNINTADQQQKHQQKPAEIIAEGKPCKGPKKKRSRTTGGGGGGEATKAKKNVRSKKGGKKQNSERTNVVVQTAAAAAAGSCCTEDEFTTVNGSADGKVDEATPTRTTSSSSNVSSEGDPALNLNGKTRASRGAATDPQSLYARKRRERINERLKVLQTLVPNGTKVDISTMLEEAVEYVKFLQLQIKLLSSDDHWMYAPIAYNGMKIGLDLKVAQHI